MIKAIIFLSFAMFARLSGVRQDPIASEIVTNQKSRIKDAWGSGQFQASRDKGNRLHNGLDIAAKPNDKVFSPINGNLIRKSVPYKNDSSFEGVVLSGTGEWVGYEIKIFYITGSLSGKVTKGQEIGIVQNLTIKYPGITNHVHIEVKKFSQQIDPFDIWRMSF